LQNEGVLVFFSVDKELVSVAEELIAVWCLFADAFLFQHVLETFRQSPEGGLVGLHDPATPQTRQAGSKKGVWTAFEALHFNPLTEVDPTDYLPPVTL
jgi:hypothetical protein